jgi:undecaprenyl diphosphate synthase
MHIPKHLAIIMDGNGRWAKKRLLPRVAGHKFGVDALRNTVETCRQRGVAFLTVFAFSSENWRRPSDEVAGLMQLFAQALAREAPKLRDNGVRLRFIGDRSKFSPDLAASMQASEDLTRANSELQLSVAMNYGGRWDVLQAAARAVADGRALDHENALDPYLSLAFAPEPDLLVRTGGEHRVSNFLLWQLAYSELVFTDTLWPDFDAAALDACFAEFARRERRFGKTSEQLASPTDVGLSGATLPRTAVSI